MAEHWYGLAVYTSSGVYNLFPFFERAGEGLYRYLDLQRKNERFLGMHSR